MSESGVNPGIDVATVRSVRTGDAVHESAIRGTTVIFRARISGAVVRISFFSEYSFLEVCVATILCAGVAPPRPSADIEASEPFSRDRQFLA